MSAENIGHRQGLSNFATEQRPVTNSVTVTDGDFVKLAQGGRVTNATIGSGRLHGVVRGSDTVDLVSRTFRNTTAGNSDGTTEVLVELVEGQRYKLPVSAALATDAEGSYYNLTGSTGAQQVDNTTKSATAGQLLCLKRVANAAGAYLFGIFTVAQPHSLVDLDVS